MGPRIEAVVDELLGRVEPRGHMDLVADFAFQLPIRVLTDILGLPSSDADKLRDWTPISPPRTPEELAEVDQGAAALVDYLEVAFAERRSEPSDDLITAYNERQVFWLTLVGVVGLLLLGGYFGRRAPG